jgi:flagellar protein FlbD
MIELTRFDGTHFYVNVEFIEFVETTPDTVVSLIDHKKLLVREPAAEVVRRIVEYHRQTMPRGANNVISMLRWAEAHGAHAEDATTSEGER